MKILSHLLLLAALAAFFIVPAQARLGLGLGLGQETASSQYPVEGQLTAAVFGNSISFANVITSGGTQRTYESVGYLTNYNILSNQRMYFPNENNLGVSGNSTADMKARMTDMAGLADVDVIFLLGGTNDITSKIAAATIIDNLDDIADYFCGTLGKRVVWLPILPRDYWPSFSAGEITQGLADIATVNTHIYSRHGDCDGKIISETAQFHDDMDDGAGGAITESTYDDLHPAPYGGMLNGIALKESLEPYFGNNPAPDFSAVENLLTNGVMAGTGGTAGSGTTGQVATSFSTTHSGGTGNTAFSKDVDGKQLLAHSTFNGTTTDNSRLIQSITQASGKFDVGDVLYGRALVEVLTSPTPVRMTQVALQLRLTGTGPPTLVNAFGNDRRQSPNWIGEVYGLTPGLYLIETPDLSISQGSGLTAEWRFEVQGDSSSSTTATATVKIHGAGIYKR
jgi:lysophospholipase L1-like esterase